MRRVLFHLGQAALTLGMLVVAFWPWWGVAYWAQRNLTEYPIVIAIGTAIWLALLALNLPLSLTQYRWFGLLTIFLGGGAIQVYLYNEGFFTGETQEEWIISAIIWVALILIWFTTSSFIWRSYRGMFGVDELDVG